MVPECDDGETRVDWTCFTVLEEDQDGLSNLMKLLEFFVTEDGTSAHEALNLAFECHTVGMVESRFYTLNYVQKMLVLMLIPMRFFGAFKCFPEHVLQDVRQRFVRQVIDLELERAAHGQTHDHLRSTMFEQLATWTTMVPMPDWSATHARTANSLIA